MSYGVGIVGLGRIAQGHIGAIGKAEGVHLAAVCDLDATRLDRVTKEQNCPGEPTLERLLARDDVDIALILLPHALHKDATIAAARAGKHVMVEKPMAMEVEACDRMIDAASQAGAKLFVAHTERFLSANRKAKELLDAGEVGTPIMATDVWYQPFRRETRQPWMLDRARGGGFLQMAGSHMIDRLVFLLGSRVRSVRASVRTAYHPDVKCDDAVLAFMELESGVPCTLGTVSYKDTANAGVDQMAVELLCTDGMLKVARRNSVFVSKAGKYEEVPTDDRAAFADEWEAFARAISSGGEPPVSLDHARHVVAVMEACEESSRTGETVQVR